MMLPIGFALAQAGGVEVVAGRSGAGGTAVVGGAPARVPGSGAVGGGAPSANTTQIRQLANSAGSKISQLRTGHGKPRLRIGPSVTRKKRTGYPSVWSFFDATCTSNSKVPALNCC
jgi:hypothetical protein